MVNIVTGEGMGLRDGSWSTVGGKHVGPNDVFGSNGESATVNLYNGNLIIQDQDALFKSLGLDSSVLRVYNSQSAKPWQFGVEKELECLTGQVNTSGSSITRVGADGHKTVYNYDVASNRYVSSGSVKDTLTVKGDTWTWLSHDESISETYINNQLVESRDANGNVTKYEYSGKDLVSITDASGQTVRFTRVDNTLTISVEKDGKTESAVTYVYDAKQRLEQVKVDLNGDGKNIYVTSYTYDGDSNRIASISHSDGTKIAFTYIESNGVYKVETMTDGLGRKISFEYLDGKTIVTDANGQKTTYEYNDKGQITQITYPAVNGKQSTISYKYNDVGLLESITDNHGNTTSFKYDANGNCIREENAAGDVIERTFDEHNHLISQKVILNKDSGKVAESHNIYDEHGNIRFHVTADGRVVEYEYDEKGNLKAEHHYSKDNYAGAFDLTSLEAWEKSQTAQSLTEYEYDFRGQVSKIITYPNSADKSIKTEVHYIYDAHGNLLQKKVFDADGKEYTSSYTYDAFARVLTEIDSLGHSTKHDYNAQTHTSTITFENGLVETYEYDDAGNLISKTANDSKHDNRLISESSYIYDDNGNLIAESSNGIAKYYFYNQLNQKIAEVDGNGHFTSYTYNDLGQLVATKQSANTVNSNSWLDSMPALADIQPQASAEERSAHNVYDKAGRVHYKIDAQGYVTEYFYNGRGDLIKETAYANKIENIPLSLDENARLEIQKSADDRSVEVFYDLDGNKTGQLDAAGYYTQYTYDAAGNLIQSTRFAEKQTTQAINDNNFKTSVNDATTQLIYNDKGQITGQIDAQGYYTETKYDSFGNVSSTTRYATKTTDGNKPTSNDKDQIITYAYNAQGQLLSSTNIDGSITNYQYDEMGNLVLTSTTDNNTRETRAKANRYDAMGRLIAELSSKGQEALDKLLKANPEGTQAQIEQIWQEYATTHLYDEAGRRIQTTDANGHATRFFYDANGQLTASINAIGEVKTYAHNAFGESAETRTYANRLTDEQLTQIKSATSGLISQSITDMLAGLASDKDSIQAFQYNNRGQLEVKTDAEHYTNRISYNAFGDITSKTQQISANKQAITEYHYDAAGQLVETIYDKDGLNIKSSTKYDAFGRVAEQTDGNSNSAAFTYDKLGRQLTATNAKQITTTSTYDAFGNVLTITDGRKNTTTYSYDAKTNSMIMTTAGGFSTRTTTNAFGDVVSVTDANNNTVSYQYDADGNLTDVTDALNHNTHYDYDNTGLKAKTTDANGNVTEYHYNAIDQVTSVIVDPNGLNIETQYQYDTNGNKIRETVVDAKSGEKRITEYLYDKNNQLTDKIIDPDGIKLTAHYDYDGQGNIITLTESDKDGTARITQYEFDALGRRAKSIVDPEGLKVTESFVYDANGNLTEKTDANGNKVHYIYDALNQLRFTVDPEGGVSENQYNENGQLIQLRRYAHALKGDALVFTETSLMQTLAVVKDDSSDLVTQFKYDINGNQQYAINAKGQVTEYRYDALGNVLESIGYAKTIEVANLDSIASLDKNSVDNQITSYVYDAASRLIATYQPDLSVQLFSYDANGNVTRTVKHAYKANQRPETKSSHEIRIPSNLVPQDASDDDSFDVTVKGGSGSYTKTVRLKDVILKGGEYSLVIDNMPRGAYTVNIAMRIGGAISGRINFDFDTVAYQTLANATVSYQGEGGIVYRDINIGVNAYDNQFDMESLQNQFEVTEKDSITKSIYDSAGRLVMQVDAEGAVTAYQYDASGNLVHQSSYAQTVKDAVSPITQSRIALSFDQVVGLDSDTVELVIWPKNFRGLKQTVEATIVNGRLVASFDSDGTHGVIYGFELKYRKNGGVVATNVGSLDVSSAGSQTLTGVFSKYEKQSDGTCQVVDEYQQFSAQVDVAYSDSDEILESLKGVSAHESRMEYDAAGRMQEATDAGGHQESFTYDALGNRISQTDKKGNTTTYAYDKNGRLAFERSPEVAVGLDGVKQSIVTAYEYDGLGNLTRKTAAYGSDSAASISYEYDSLGRLTTTRMPETKVYNPKNDTLETQVLTTTNYYDNFGNVVSIQDSAGNYRYNIYDKMGNVLFDVDANRQVTGYQYDSFGNAISVTRYAETLMLTGEPSFITENDITENLQTASADRTIEQKYDANNRLIEKRLPKTAVYDSQSNSVKDLAGVEQYAYDAFGQLVKESHNRLQNGVEVFDSTYHYYDKNGQLIVNIDSQGYVTQNVYDSFGNVVKTLEYANALTGSWDEKVHRLPKTSGDYKNPLGEGMQSGQDRVTEYQYDALNQLKRETKKNIWFSSISDTTGRFISQRGDVSKHYSYDASGNMIASESSYYDIKTGANIGVAGKSMLYYNEIGQLIASVGPETAAGRELTTFVYDANGNQVSIKRWANGALSADEKSYTAGASDTDNDQISQVHYNALGQVIVSIDAKGHTANMAYDAAGNLARTRQTQTDYDKTEHVRTLINRYDNVGNLIQTTEDLLDDKQAINQYRYNAFGEMIASGHDDQWIVEYAYDNNGNLWRTNENGVLRYNLYDLQGHVTLSAQGINDKVLDGVTDVASLLYEKDILKVQNRYDSLGNLVQQTSLSANDNFIHQSQTYDRWGNVLTQTDVYGNQTNYWYNDNNQVIKQQKPKVEYYDFDKSKHEKNPTNIYAYDALGRELGYLDPSQVSQKTDDGDEMTYASFSSKQYDSMGRVVKEVNADGGWTSYEYDNLGRLTKRGWLVDDATGRVGAYSYQYDQMDNMVEQHLLDEGKDRLKVKYGYDELGNVIIQTNGADESLSYRYGTQDNIIEVRLNSGKKSLASYDGYGHKLSQTDALGVKTSFEYDDFGRITKQRVEFAGNETVSKTNLEYTYEYNLAGQLTKQTATNLNSSDMISAAKEYIYYANGSIKSIRDIATGSLTEYEYNDAGSMTHEKLTIKDKVYQDSSYEYDVLNRLSEINDNLDKYHIEYRYDENDNRRAVIAEDKDGNKQENWYDYDGANRVAKRRGTENADLIYDKMGNRIYESGKNGNTINRYDAEGVLVQSSGSQGNFKREYDDAGRVIREYDYRNKESREMEYDADGNVSVVTAYKYTNETKGSQKYKTTYDYDAAGNQTSYVMKTNDYTNTYNKKYSYVDGYKVQEESGTSTYFKPGHSRHEYDVYGRLVKVTDVQDGKNNQEFILNDKGEIVQKTQGDKLERYYYVDGQVIGDVKGKMGANGELIDGVMDFDKNITPVSQNAGATPSTVIIQNGDTLESLAQRLWGDSSLWYLLADANGLSGREAVLKEGMTLNVPNYTGALHNTSDTFKPYNPGSILGDLTPTMPAPPPPKKSWWKTALMVVVAIVATIYTAGLAATYLAPSVGAISSATSVWAAGTAVMSGAAGFGMGVAASAFAGGAIGSIASQATGVALGAQDKIDFKGAMLTGLTAMATAGIGAGINKYANFGFLDEFEGVQKAVRAGISDGLSQEINKTLGIQEHFNWREVAAAGAGAALSTTGFGKALDKIPGVGKSLNSIAQNAYVTKGHMDAGSIIGAYVGNSIVDTLSQQPKNTEEKVEEAQRNNAQNSVGQGDPLIMDSAAYANGRTELQKQMNYMAAAKAYGFDNVEDFSAGLAKAESNAKQAAAEAAAQDQTQQSFNSHIDESLGMCVVDNGVLNSVIPTGDMNGSLLALSAGKYHASGTEGTPLFRGDGRSPEVIYEEGFKPQGNNTDLLSFVEENKPSIYVSTTKAEDMGQWFAELQGGGYNYKVDSRVGGIDVNEELNIHQTNLPDESEMAIPGGVEPKDIISAAPVNEDGEYSGKYIKNPKYQANYDWQAKASLGLNAAVTVGMEGYELKQNINYAKQTGDYIPLKNQGAGVSNGVMFGTAGAIAFPEIAPVAFGIGYVIGRWGFS